jgi:SRSO17 transposase
VEKEHAPSSPELDLLDVQVWGVYWTEIERRIGSLFARSEARERAVAYLAGLLSPAERKNAWQLAEQTGYATPYAFQHLLGRADWDPDALRDRLRSYVLDYLADPDAIGVIDETGFLKKGTHSAGVARQYSGTAGRVENCQIGVFLAYTSDLGHTLIDRELYLPEDWTNDRERCRRAGIPDERLFATKPVLARQMLERAFEGGLRLQWVTGDCVYGDARHFRRWLEARLQRYILGVSPKETVWIGSSQHRIKAIIESLPDQGWERLSAGAGSKGPRYYDWLRLEINPPEHGGWKRWLVFRRSISDPSEIAAYIAFAPATSSLDEQVRTAGKRWTVEESIQTAKGEVGLDHYEVRSWTGWYRHITLAMWAQAFLSVVRAETGTQVVPKKGLQEHKNKTTLAEFKASRGLRSD